MRQTFIVRVRWREAGWYAGLLLSPRGGILASKMVAPETNSAIRQELEAKLAWVPRESVRERICPAPLIFVHLPKAGGTTLQDEVVSHYRGARGFRFTGDADRLEAFKALSQEERDSFDLLQGHMHFGLHALLTRPATYITMLRDPVDRVVSHYHFVLANPDHYLYPQIAGRGISLHDYAVTRASHELDNDQVRWLCAADHFDVEVGRVSRAMVDEAKWNLANVFEVVGLVERFDDSLRCLRAAFGWQGTGRPERKNVNSHRPRLEEVPADALDAIRRVNRYDVELYEFAVGLFEEQMTRLLNPASTAGP
jgi:hypothetical protein